MTALVIGIGNRLRGDDAAGPEVAARVAELGVPGVAVVVEDEPLALVEHLARHDEVVVVDAVAPRGDAGRVLVWRVGSTPLERDVHPVGSHGLGVAEAVELARAIGPLPTRLTLVGVEAQTLSLGAPLSSAVRDRIGDAVDAVLDALSAASGPSGLSSPPSGGTPASTRPRPLRPMRRARAGSAARRRWCC